MTQPEAPKPSELNLKEEVGDAPPPKLFYSDDEILQGLLSRASISKTEAKEERSHRLWRETIASLSVTAMKLTGFVVIVIALRQSAEIIKADEYDARAKTLAENTIALVIGGIAGFSLGKASK